MLSRSYSGSVAGLNEFPGSDARRAVLPQAKTVLNLKTGASLL